MPDTYRNRRTGTLVTLIARATHAHTSAELLVYRDAQQFGAPIYADSPEGFEARFERVEECVTHVCPLDGQAVTPCCGRTPFELPRTDRMAVDPTVATCGGLVEVERARVVFAAAHDMLKGGAHEGECTNEHEPDDACELHVETARARRAALREALFSAEVF